MISRLDGGVWRSPLAKLFEEHWKETRSNPPHNDYVPPGFQNISDAIEDSGRAIFPNAWTGFERCVSAEKLQQVAEILGGPQGLGRDLLWVHALPDELRIARSDAELDACFVQLLKRRIATENRDARQSIMVAKKTRKPPRVIGGSGSSLSDEDYRAKRVATIKREADRIVHWCEKMLASLPKEEDAKRDAAEIAERRSVVEKAARDVLYSGKIVASLIDKDGMAQMAASEWATEVASRAIDGPPPGVFVRPTNPNHGHAVLVEKGAMAKAVMSGRRPRPKKAAPKSKPASEKPDHTGKQIQEVLDIAERLYGGPGMRSHKKAEIAAGVHNNRGCPKCFSLDVVKRIIGGHYKPMRKRDIESPFDTNE